MSRRKLSAAALLAIASLTAACTEILGHYEVIESSGGGGSGGAQECGNSGSHGGPGNGCGGDSSGKGP